MPEIRTVRLAALSALHDLGCAAAGTEEDLRRAAGDPDPGIANKAADALKNIESKIGPKSWK